MRMPEPDASVIARRAEIARDLRALIGEDGVIAGEDRSEERRVGKECRL